MRWAIAAFILLAAAAQADETHIVSQGPLGRALTPAAFTQRFEASAREFREQYPGNEAIRFVKIDLAFPDEGAEYEAFGHQAIAVLGAVSHDESELPLARAYVRQGGRDTELKRLFSVRRPFAPGSAAAEVYGPVREDSAYLVPVALMTNDAQLLCDFSAHRTGFMVSHTVGNPSPALRAHATPGPDPSTDALRTFMQREYPGFMPDALP